MPFAREPIFRWKFSPRQKSPARAGGRHAGGRFRCCPALRCLERQALQPLGGRRSWRHAVIFVRHRSGPTYYGYECLGGVRHLKTPSPELWQQNSGRQPRRRDARRSGRRRLRRSAVAAAGALWTEELLDPDRGPGRRGGKWDAEAPAWPRALSARHCRSDVRRPARGALKTIQADAKLQTQLAAWTDRYLAIPNTKLETRKEFAWAFALYLVFRQWLREHQAPAITINACMGTILNVSDTTACMPLSWLNDRATSPSASRTS